jgi:hypothetical protein
LQGFLVEGGPDYTLGNPRRVREMRVPHTARKASVQIALYLLRELRYNEPEQLRSLAILSM